MRQRRFNSFVILLLPLLLAACSPGPDRGPKLRNYSLSQAKRVSALPPSFLSYKSPVKILFAQDVPGVQARTVDARPLLAFQPEVKGKAVWIGRNQLEFTPDQPWEKFREYRGQLHLATVFNRRDLKPLAFSFETIGNEVASLEAGFQPAASGAKYVYVYSGHIELADEVALADLQVSLSLTQAKRRLGLTLQGPDRGKRFQFQSVEIAKTDQIQRFRLQLKKEKLDLPADVSRDAELQKQRSFKVEKIESLGQEDQKGILVTFTDHLASRQSPEGFISVKPALAVKLKRVDDKLYVFGDFAIGQGYDITVAAGLKSLWNDGLQEPASYRLFLEDMKPKLRFTGPGVFLPSDNQHKIAFQSVNVKQVKLTVVKVFANNLGQFLQTQRLASSTDAYFSGEMQRVGVTVKEQTLELGSVKNKWLTHQLDLKDILRQEDKGLFHVSLAFTQADSLYQAAEATPGDGAEREGEGSDNYYDYGSGAYYTDPAHSGYYYRNGTISLPVILSDIGLTVKKAEQRYYVFASNLLTTAPLPGVVVHLKTYQNQVVGQQTTNYDGVALFENVEPEVFYVEGQAGKQRSVVKLSEMAWNLSGCDVGGLEVMPGGLRAYLFTDRGVYRPGDPIRLGMIVRNQAGGFPENHPVTVKFSNPKNQLMLEKTVTQGRDGFYALELTTRENDPTGEWTVEVGAGGAIFRKPIKVETVVPNRLKVEVTTAKPLYSSLDRRIAFEVQAQHLFGAPAAGLRAEIQGSLEQRALAFPAYPGYTFSHEAVTYQPLRAELAATELGPDGSLASEWLLPDLNTAAGGLSARITARVFEKGGRYTSSSATVAVDPYPAYVGLEQPALEYGYVQIPNEYQARAILLTPQGKPISGSTLQYRLYKNRHWWWWEYREQEADRRLKFKTDSATELVASGSVLSRKTPVPVRLRVEEEGQYLLEIQDGEEGHSAGYFFYGSVWGGSERTSQDAASVMLKADKPNYAAGETAVVSFPAPGQGRVLCTLEQGNRVLKHWWTNLDQARKTCTVKVKLTEDMAPNVYLSVSVLQPHSQSKNDLPARLYGVLPLAVEKAGTRRALTLHMKDELRPGEDFDVEVRSPDRKPYQAVVAVVDEGLLGLTNFATPDPWAHFYQKLRLGVATYDLYSQVIGANPEDVFRLFSIGGGESLSGQMNPVEAKRFKPVALFQGPLASDEQGRLRLRFTMPHYIGAVRVMVVAADNMAFGSVSQTVPVRKELMVQPTLPRVLGPNERFSLPVEVITMKPGVGAIDLQVSATGPVAVDGESRRRLVLDQPGTELVMFTMKTAAAVGPATVRVEATSGKFSSLSATEIAVRPSSPRIATTLEKSVQKGGTLTLAIPQDGMPGSNQARLSVKRLPALNLDKRLAWLIHYPYGCIEQTTSSVFPQLYLKAFLRSRRSDQAIDQNINAGISRLKTFVTPSGGFAYWPGNGEADPWGTSYAGHFLLEARRLGYHVPEAMLNAWLRFQHSMALKAEGDMLQRVYRLYLLALAKDPDLAAMNLIKENHLSLMSNPERWLLGAAYQLAGHESVSREMLAKAGTDVKPYTEPGSTYGSLLRDQAVILETLVLTNRMEEAKRLFEILGASLSQEAWYSTQSVAYALLAMGKYLNKLDLNYHDKRPRLAGWIELPGATRMSFDTQDPAYVQEIAQGFGGEARVHLGPGTTVSQAYVALDWSGIPLEDKREPQAKNLELGIEWLDDEGQPFDPSAVQQGKSFWGKITVNRKDRWEEVKNVALVQVLPSGWEIENLRLSGLGLPDWAESQGLAKEDYLDIRDDRIMWFFDLARAGDERRAYSFLFKVNAVTAGEFRLPPTLVEAMYDDAFRATASGRTVTVTPGFKITGE